MATMGSGRRWLRSLGTDLNDYYTYNSTAGQYQYTQKFANTTIAGLMYGIADQTHFKTRLRVTPTGWVLIYKVEY